MISASAPAEVARIGRPLPSNTCSRLVVRLTAAYAEARKPRKVRPIWVTARKRPGCAIRPLTRFADRFPSSASCSMRVRRIVTRAISAATKTPSSTVRMTMTTSWRIVSI